MKDKIINITIILFGLLIGGLIGEWGVRMLAPQKLLRPCSVTDPDIAFKGVPDCEYLDNWKPEFYEYYVNLNNYGLRMERDIKDEDQDQVLCLGDSFTFGMGVSYDQTFFGLLEKWADKFGISNKMINAGVLAYSTGHCRKSLEMLSEDIDVEKVIYFMYFNDIFDNVNRDVNYRCFDYQIDEKEQVELKSVQVYSPLKRLWYKFTIVDWLYKNSHLVALIKNAIRGQRPAFVNNSAFFKKNLSDEQIRNMRLVTLKHLELLAEECKEKDLELLLVYIPCWRELGLENDFGWDNNFPFETYKEEMWNTLDAYPNVQYLDPTELLNQQLNQEKPLLSKYYFGEGHYTEKGNLWFYNSVKEEVLRFIEE